ncbi:MAG: hypothetical protein JO093_03425 [Acidobacteria bacterium]|nr:hypothetical protein [Acidobacteriota bacterium]MBV9069176.1 hypothetical protein [Acidobacteriota bacterium]MBV9184640.1 hypothetical protein [Acidobacteriota bacterium]
MTDAEQDDIRQQRKSLWVNGIGLFVVAAGFLGLVFWRLMMMKKFGPFTQIDQSVQWFDAWFFTYNLLLVVFAVLIVPFLTIHYVGAMKYEKQRRLRRELCEGPTGQLKKPVWGETREECIQNIKEHIDRQFRLRTYIPSLVGMMIAIAFGAAILLLSKPVFFFGIGVDYGRGTNMLLAGARMENYLFPNLGMFRQVLLSLCAFQFGFLGAYIYAISNLIWSYFNVDLTPHTLIAGTVRMVFASVLSLVLSFAIPLMSVGKFTDAQFVQLLPVFAFFLGFFPDRGLVYLQSVARFFLRIESEIAATPVRTLPGVGISDEGRLASEGYESVELFEHSDSLDLAIRTGYSYTQLSTWRDQAWLASRMREQYRPWVTATGILGREELQQYFLREGQRVSAAIEELSASAKVPATKLRALYLLLCGPVVEPVAEVQPQTLSATGEGSKNPTSPIVQNSSTKV